MIGSNPDPPIGTHLRITLSRQLGNPDASTAARPWFATCLALVGWIGLLLPFADVHWNFQIRYGYAPPLVSLYLQVFAWFVTGVTLVAVDTFRSKTTIERVFWAIAAPFWVMALLIAFVWSYESEWLHKLPYNPFSHFIIIEFMPIEFFGTVFLLTPLYVVYLSLVATKAWLLRLRHRRS